MAKINFKIFFSSILDGKFILELARSKEGDRGWISVPRKTYWPPAALSQNNLNNHKNESSTSLSCKLFHVFSIKFFSYRKCESFAIVVHN